MKNSKFGTTMTFAHHNFFKTGIFSICIMINGRALSFYRSMGDGKLKFEFWENAWRKMNMPILPPFDFNPKK